MVHLRSRALGGEGNVRLPLSAPPSAEATGARQHDEVVPLGSPFTPGRRRRPLCVYCLLCSFLVLFSYRSMGRLVPAGLLFLAKQGLQAEYLSYKMMEMEALSPSSCSLVSPSPRDSAVLRTDAGGEERQGGKLR